MNTAKWINKWFIIVLGVFGTIGIFNFIIDPYGFNNTIVLDGINKIKEDNTRFPFKYKIPRVQKGGWDNLMLGTSKIGVMDTKPVDTLLGGRTFNLSLPASTVISQYDVFMYAVKFNKIKNVIYGIDFLSFNKNLKLNDNYLQFKDILKSYKSLYNYDIYLNFDTLKTSFKAIRNNRSKIPRMHPYYSTTGVRHYANFIQLSKEPGFDMQKRIHKLLQEFFRDWVYAKYIFSREDMYLFGKIVAYCHSHDINLYVYIPPMYVDHFNAIKESGLNDAFKTFKKELVKITDYVDFTGVNAMTKNSNNFWDSTHLRIDMTSVIMKNVIGDKKIKKDKQFGIFVTKKNIKGHLEKQEAQYQKINLKKIFDEDLKDVISF
jgi:hypothetical protein